VKPVKAGRTEQVETRLTVNGTPATLTLPARVTLADALRDHLNLTGTHVGCEHGVCGMCTVLVDGEAVRACLMFAAQADGAEIVTVEGLGRPDKLHPLQESFGRNHALQCGFCTPGFLMSGYDLLTRRPAVPDEELAAELSGVICRCTGYRNILTAIREVRDSYPDGVPPPGNCAPSAPVFTPARSAAGPEPPSAGADGTAEIVLPNAEPTVSVTVSAKVAAPAEQVWRVFADTSRLARCLPGAELTGDLGGNRYAGRARVSVGPIKLTFHGVAHIAEFDTGGQRMRVLAQGRDAGGAQTQAEIVLRTDAAETGAADSGTVLHADARLYLTGRIAQFGRSLASDVSRRMFAQFAEAVAEAATTGSTPTSPVKAPSAAGLLLAALLGRLRQLLRRSAR
jgi:xanthine dehydrogenase YagT iron-sulfur-binding subunit